MITAPFNFVPLSENVFFPDWAEEVSHDVPFEDAQSGVIDISIEAKSPIFIRNSEREGNGSEFCNYQGTYFIPGSSIKGMVRNVLEIMSFGKMSRFDDNTYAVRDLSKSDNFYMTQMREEVLAGWFYEKDGEYFIDNCGVPGRIRHEEIDKALPGKAFASKFKADKFKTSDTNKKTAKYKYEILGGPYQKIKVGELYKSAANPKYDKRLFCKYSANGREGTLVLTGQPTPRKDTGKMGDGKGFEFVFFDVKDTLEVKKEVVEKFLFAYFDKRTTQPLESPDWTYWKKRLAEGKKVPVFFQKKGKEVLHFGLSYLYKLPYKHSVKDGLPPMHKDERKDLADVIFGYVDNNDALKGRVQFSHFKAVEGVNVLNVRTEILGTPRASYYPMYVRQHGGKLKTFMDTGFSIAGWKRYPVHKGASVTETKKTGNDNVGTAFAPLAAGVLFRGKLRYHNLKKAEIGAILSALTFHNTQGCYHNIGMAKSLGYGKIAVKVNGVDDLETYLKAFETEVSGQIEAWASSQQLKELLAMATEQDNSGNSVLRYMELKAFAKNKTSQNYLDMYTRLENIKSPAVTSLISPEDLEALKLRQEKRREMEKQREEERKKEEQHAKEWGIVSQSNTISTIETFIRKYPQSPYVEKAKQMIETIRAQEEEERVKEAQKEALEKWENIQKVEKKYLKKALEDYIQNYPDSPKKEDAAKKLKEMEQNTQTEVEVTVAQLEKASDGKKFKELLKKMKTFDVEEVKAAAVACFKQLKSKKQKNFFKEAQLKASIGEENETEVKQAVGAK